MTQNLTDFLNKYESKQYAIRGGNKTHALLKHVIIDTDKVSGDANLVAEIQQHPDLPKYFSSSAKTEVPIAGYIDGTFHSRRIDRLLINSDTKQIDFIDYKTDTDKTKFISEYKKQLSNYATLLKSAYPEYKINGFILWMTDWTIDQII